MKNVQTLFGMCLAPEEINNQFFGSTVFHRKMTMFIGLEQKHTIYRITMTEKFR